ncbi:MAG: hydroxylamine oxidoreductase [Magnetococcus sp. YQC-5]
MDIRSKSNFQTKAWNPLHQERSRRHPIHWLVLVMVLVLLPIGVRTAQAAEAVPAAAPAAPAVAEQEKRGFNGLSKISATCVSCHAEENRAIVQQWGNSKHYGANVGCYECHKAEKEDADAFMHKKYLISILVTPKDCARCHETETKQFTASKHAKSGGNLEGSVDHALATTVQSDGTPAGTQTATLACVQCHGSTVKVAPSGKLDPATWPNSGIGRINPDGSVGACSSCHQNHDFSQTQVRSPDACGKCHQGPAHSQKEIYEASKHGANYRANFEKMHLDSPKWIPGQDYVSGPTCVTCHMSPTMDVAMTHDVGQRISWDLTQPISKKTENAEAHRQDMRDVCSSCHTDKVSKNFYEQFDSIVKLYNSKYGEPGTRLMDGLLKANLRSKKSFDDAIEWTWFKLWHQAGRKARQGAAMQAPDFVQWQGFYEVAELFYTQLIPQAEELITKAEAGGRGTEVAEVRKLLNDIKNDPSNKWMKGQ